MFGLKLTKKETIENYEKEILSLKAKLATAQESLDAEVENSRELLNKFTDATREINELRDRLNGFEHTKPTEKKTRKKPVKDETEETPAETPKQIPRKKMVYRKKTENKPE